MSAAFNPTGAKSTPVEKKIGGSTVRLQHGDLCALPVDAFVFYAREDLALGSGYGTAIQMRGGVAVKNELAKIGAIKMGEAVITGAGAMTARRIIHACGPKFQEAELERKLADCMESALKLAADNGLKTLAFPPMGAGFYGVPLDLSAKVMLAAIKQHLAGRTSLTDVIICVNDYRDYAPFAKAFETL
ncbi:MAG TPA: macro domain-containing protein [bacterium]|nr:macro domain-containing protein [bacterium]